MFVWRYLYYDFCFLLYVFFFSFVFYFHFLFFFFFFFDLREKRVVTIIGRVWRFGGWVVHGRFSGRFGRSGRIPNVLYVRSSLLPAGRIYVRLSRRFRRAGEYLVWAGYQTFRTFRTCGRGVTGGAYSWAGYQTFRTFRTSKQIFFWKKCVLRIDVRKIRRYISGGEE